MRIERGPETQRTSRWHGDSLRSSYNGNDPGNKTRKDSLPPVRTSLHTAHQKSGFPAARSAEEVVSTRNTYGDAGPDMTRAAGPVVRSEAAHAPQQWRVPAALSRKGEKNSRRAHAPPEPHATTVPVTEQLRAASGPSGPAVAHVATHPHLPLRYR